MKEIGFCLLMKISNGNEWHYKIGGRYNLHIQKIRPLNFRNKPLELSGRLRLDAGKDVKYKIILSDQHFYAKLNRLKSGFLQVFLSVNRSLLGKKKVTRNS